MMTIVSYRSKAERGSAPVGCATIYERIGTVSPESVSLRRPGSNGERPAGCSDPAGNGRPVAATPRGGTTRNPKGIQDGAPEVRGMRAGARARTVSAGEPEAPGARLSDSKGQTPSGCLGGRTERETPGADGRRPPRRLVRRATALFPLLGAALPWCTTPLRAESLP